MHPWGQKFVTTYDSGSHCQRIAFLGFVLHVVYMKGPMAHLCKWWNFSLTCSVVENNILINISDLSHQLSFIKDSKYLCYGYYMFCSCSKHHYSGLNSWERLFFECSKCIFFYFDLVCSLEIGMKYSKISLIFHINGMKYIFTLKVCLKYKISWYNK